MKHDTLIFGALTGFVGNILKEVFLWTLYLMGISQYTTVLLIADVFSRKQVVLNFYTFITGFATDWTIAALLGILLLLIIKFTGKDYTIIKGIMFSSLVYVFLYVGVIFFRTSNSGSFTHFIFLIAHLLFGIGSGWYIKRYHTTREDIRIR